MGFLLAWLAVIALGSLTIGTTRERGAPQHQTGHVLRVPHRRSRMLWMLFAFTYLSLALTVFLPSRNQGAIYVYCSLLLVLVVLEVRTAHLSVRITNDALVVRRTFTTVTIPKSQVQYLDITNYSEQDVPVFPGVRLFAVSPTGEERTVVLDLTRGYRHCPHLARLLGDVTNVLAAQPGSLNEP